MQNVLGKVSQWSQYSLYNHKNVRRSWTLDEKAVSYSKAFISGIRLHYSTLEMGLFYLLDGIIVASKTDYTKKLCQLQP